MMDKLLTGFRKKYFIVIGIVAAIMHFGSMLIHMITGSTDHCLSSEEMSGLRWIIAIAGGIYSMARALPGSPGYTAEDLRPFDKTLASPPSQPPSNITQ